MPTTLKADDAAPDFDLEDDRGGRVKLGDLRGAWVVVYWYPKTHLAARPRRVRSATAGA